MSIKYLYLYNIFIYRQTTEAVSGYKHTIYFITLFDPHRFLRVI